MRMLLRGTLLVMVLALLLVGCDKQSAHIAGVVTSDNTGETLQGVLVRIEDQQTTTDAAGHYELLGLEEDTITLSAELAGHESYTRKVSVGKDTAIVLDIALHPVPKETGSAETPSADSTETGKEDVIEAETPISPEVAILRGTVIDADTQEPIPGVVMQGDSGVNTDPFEVVTDANGQYEIVRHRTGRVWFTSISKEGYKTRAGSPRATLGKVSVVNIPLFSLSEAVSESAAAAEPVLGTPSVIVTPEASYDSQDVFLEQVSADFPVSASQQRLTPVWELSLKEEHDLDKPFTVEVPMQLEKLLDKTEILTAAYWNGEEWIPIGGELGEDDIFRFTLTHFSKYTVLKLNLPLIPVRTEHFRVVSVVPGEDLDLLAERLENAWKAVIEEMGFLEPITTLGGQRINVWVRPFLGAAGAVDCTDLAEHLFDYVNYNIYLRANLSGVAAASTPAHEFFHVVQINSYLHPYEKVDAVPYLWWMEATAVWIGSISADREGSFARGAEYKRLVELVDTGLIEDSLTSPSHFHPYLVGPFVEFLESKVPGMVRETWSHIGTLAFPLDSLNQVCTAHGENLLELYGQFLLDYYFAHSLLWLQWDGVATRSITVTAEEPGLTLKEPLPPLAGAAVEITLTSNEATVPVEFRFQGPTETTAHAFLLGTIHRKVDGQWSDPEITALTQESRIPLPETTQAIGLVILNSEDNYTMADAHQTFTVVYEVSDNEPPIVELTAIPPNFAAEDEVHFEWKGSDNETLFDKLEYSYLLQGHDSVWSSWSPLLESSYPKLTKGSYQFMVRARDAAGNVSKWPAVCSFNVGSEDDLNWTARYWSPKNFGEEAYPGRMRVLADPGGRVYVLNEDVKHDTINLVLLSRTVEPTLLWSVPDDAVSGIISDVAVDGRGVCHIVATTRSDPGRDQYLLYYRISRDGQVFSLRPSWGEYETAIGKDDVRLKVSSEGTVHVLMSADYVYYGTTQDGDQWFVTRVLENKADDGRGYEPGHFSAGVLDFAVTREREPHVLWSDEDKLYYSYQKDEDWVSERLPDTGRTFARGALALNDNGEPQAIASGSHDDTLFYFYKQDSGIWSKEELLGEYPKLVNLSSSPLYVSGDLLVDDFECAVDSQGDTCILLTGTREHCFITRHNGTWHFEPILRRPPGSLAGWAISRDGVPYLVFVETGSNTIVQLTRTMSQVPSLSQKMDIPEPWPTTETTALYNENGEEVLWKDLLSSPSVVVFWDMWAQRSADDFEMQLAEFWIDHAPSDLQLLLIGITKEGTWKNAWLWDSEGRTGHGYAFVQYQLLLERARRNGFEHSGYFFHGPLSHLPGFIKEDAVYCFDEAGYPLTYFPNAASENLSTIRRWLTEMIPIIKDVCPNLRLVSGVQSQLLGELRNWVDKGVLDAWRQLSPLMGGASVFWGEGQPYGWWVLRERRRILSSI